MLHLTTVIILSILTIISFQYFCWPYYFVIATICFTIVCHFISHLQKRKTKLRIWLTQILVGGAAGAGKSSQSKHIFQPITNYH